MPSTLSPYLSNKTKSSKLDTLCIDTNVLLWNGIPHSNIKFLAIDNMRWRINEMPSRLLFHLKMHVRVEFTLTKSLREEEYVHEYGRWFRCDRERCRPSLPHVRSSSNRRENVHHVVNSYSESLRNGHEKIVATRVKFPKDPCRLSLLPCQCSPR